jgi:hypothetical protein
LNIRSYTDNDETAPWFIGNEATSRSLELTHDSTFLNRIRSRHEIRSISTIHLEPFAVLGIRTREGILNTQKKETRGRKTDKKHEENAHFPVADFFCFVQRLRVQLSLCGFLFFVRPTWL